MPRRGLFKLPSTRRSGRSPAIALAISLAAVPAIAEEQPRVFAGGAFGIAALSPDSRFVSTGSDAAVSLYDAKTGPALNIFAGVHVAEYFSVQANWIWNRNDLSLMSSFATPQAGGFYEQRRRSHQHAGVIDALVYFRRLGGPIRPYLGTGLALLHFSSEEFPDFVAHGLTPPVGRIASTRVGLRSHVGIDVRLSHRLDFRYSFSETISGNPISPSLTPPARHGLMNFQNLFGFVSRF